MGSLENRNKKIIEMYKEGMSLRDISKEIGNISCQGVSNILKSNGVKLRKREDAIRNYYETYLYVHPKTVEIVKLYSELGSGIKVAKKLNIPFSTVYSILKKCNVKVKKAGSPKSKEFVDKVIKLYKSGMTLQEVANEMGLKAYSTILRILKRNNIPRRKPCDWGFKKDVIK